MPDLPFGEWLPDQAPVATVGTQYIRNALPSATGYLPVPSLSDANESGITGPASLLFHVADSSRNVFVFAGDPTKLYQLTSGSGFADVSKVGGYNSGTPWKHVRYGDFVYLVNGVDPMQAFELGADSAFGDAANLPSGLTGRFIAVVRDFVVLGYVNDNAGVPSIYQVRWSALGNPGSWTPDPSTMSGLQDIPDLGEVRGITGGDFGTILLEDGLVRMDFIGPPAIMQFDQIDGAVGCKEPASVIRVEDATFYLADEGWHRFNGQNSEPIGSEKIDRWFAVNAIQEELPKMSAINIPQLSAVGWLFTSVNTPDGKHDKILLYAYDVNRWGIMDVAGPDCLGTAATVGISLDDLAAIYPSIDDIPAPLDSAIWKGSNFAQTSAIKDGGLFLFTGSVLDGELETIERSFTKQGKTVVVGMVPQVDGASTVTVDVGTRNATNTNNPEWVRAAMLDENAGYVPLRSVGKFHRFRLKLEGGWHHAVGVDVEAKPMGRR